MKNVKEHVRKRILRIHFTRALFYGAIWNLFMLFQLLDPMTFLLTGSHYFIKAILRIFVSIGLSYLFARKEMHQFQAEAFVAAAFEGLDLKEETFHEIGKTGIFLSKNLILFEQRYSYHLLAKDAINTVESVGQRFEEMQKRFNALVLSVGDKQAPVTIIYQNDAKVSAVQAIQEWLFAAPSMRGYACPHCGQNNPLFATHCQWCAKELFNPYATKEEDMGFHVLRFEEKVEQMYHVLSEQFKPMKMSIFYRIVFLGILILLALLWYAHFQGDGGLSSLYFDIQTKLNVFFM